MGKNGGSTGKSGVNWVPKRGCIKEQKEEKGTAFPSLSDSRTERRNALCIEYRPENGDREVGKLCGTFVKLQPTDDAVVGQILGDPLLGNA